MKTSDSINNLIPAMLQVQSSINGIVKNSENPFHSNRYVDLPKLLTELRPKLTEHGLVISQHPTSTPEGIGVTTLVIHTSGEFMQSECILPLSKPTPMEAGSCISYARRYSILSIFGIPTVDDDSQLAMQAVDRKEEKDNQFESLLLSDLEAAAKKFKPLGRKKQSEIYKSLPDELKAIIAGPEFVEKLKNV